ncbi:MAG: ribonuclease J [Lachnospiraceae bacterium]|nr:ribonuclease J [Lachnospiraceae bacterium]
MNGDILKQKTVSASLKAPAGKLSAGRNTIRAEKRNHTEELFRKQTGRAYLRKKPYSKRSVLNESAERGKVKIIPLGGLGQIGMNITCFEYKDTIVVVDCGMAFPEDDMMGIDMVIPDVSYLKDNLEKVKGFVITHGHEDHIGAMGFVLRTVNVPIYATKLTMGIIEGKLSEHDLLDSTERHVVSYGENVVLGDMRVEFIKTNHSIADAAALAIKTPAGTIIHTGDFKIDYTPLFGASMDLQRIAELGRKGILALMCDSTNADRHGFTPSDKTVAQAFDNIFAVHRHSRLIIATFASNVDRVQLIMNIAADFRRKVVIDGRSMVNTIAVASELGYISIPENTLIDIDEMKDYEPEQLVLITTGSQGETMAALSRMANGTHKKVTISNGDIVIFSSSTIPGNEKAISNIMNEIYEKGADIIFQDTHVSGHACEEEIKLLHALAAPTYAIPIHGEYRHLKANAGIAERMGVKKENIFLLRNGDILELNKDEAAINGTVTAGGIMVDGLGVGDVGNIVIRERQLLSQNGLIIVVISLDRNSGTMISGPDIISRGFVYVRESEELMEEARKVVENTVYSCLDRHYNDWNKIKVAIKDQLGDYIWKQMKRSPMILPVIIDLSL